MDLWGSPLTVEAVSAARTVRDCLTVCGLWESWRSQGSLLTAVWGDVPGPVAGDVDGREHVGLLHHFPVAGLAPDRRQGPGDDQQDGLHVGDGVRQDGYPEAM